jgi:hypothetical protein
MDKTNVIKLAIDTARNKPLGNYSMAENSEALRKAFIEANNGSDKIDVKSFRRHPELYDILEEIVPVIIQEGLKGDEFFMNFVDYRNQALGDDTRFWTEDNSLFLVSEMAHGSMSVRRQRLNAGTYSTVTTSLKAIKVFEELNRLLTGRVDFNVFVDRVGKSMMNKVYNDIFTLFNGITVSTSGMNATYYKSGSYAEDTLITLVDHVEAAMGGNATIIGTRSALRKVTSAVICESAKQDMFDMGYYGKFNGTPMIRASQKHVTNTDTFILDDTKLYIVAGNEKFIKMVDVGEGLLFESDPMSNSDLTREYFYGNEYGVGISLNGRIGVLDL